MHVRVAMQMVFGTLSNILINRPGPLEIGDDATAEELGKAAIRYLGLEEAGPRQNEDREGFEAAGIARPARANGGKDMNDHAKGAAMLGCSTSGEILGDMVADDYAGRQEWSRRGRTRQPLPQATVRRPCAL
jgi:hypothetical protein